MQTSHQQDQQQAASSTGKGTILVTGGAGYIGSHTLVDLI
jgi:FlaA1/EpsC-like NDP-sugar epimerase